MAAAYDVASFGHENFPSAAGSDSWRNDSPRAKPGASYRARLAENDFRPRRDDARGAGHDPAFPAFHFLCHAGDRLFLNHPTRCGCLEWFHGDGGRALA